MKTVPHDVLHQPDELTRLKQGQEWAYIKYKSVHRSYCFYRRNVAVKFPLCSVRMDILYIFPFSIFVEKLLIINMIQNMCLYFHFKYNLNRLQQDVSCVIVT